MENSITFPLCEQKNQTKKEALNTVYVYWGIVKIVATWLSDIMVLAESYMWSVPSDLVAVCSSIATESFCGLSPPDLVAVYLLMSTKLAFHPDPFCNSAVQYYNVNNNGHLCVDSKVWL